MTAKTFLRITLTLKKVGVRRHYRGYPRLVYAISLVLEDEHRLEAITKEVYMPVAEKYRCSWKSVERSLRTMRDMIWREKREALGEITGFELTEPPRESYLLEILATFVKYGNLDKALQSLEEESSGRYLLLPKAVVTKPFCLASAIVSSIYFETSGYAAR